MRGKRRFSFKSVQDAHAAKVSVFPAIFPSFPSPLSSVLPPSFPPSPLDVCLLPCLVYECTLALCAVGVLFTFHSPSLLFCH